MENLDLIRKIPETGMIMDALNLNAEHESKATEEYKEAIAESAVTGGILPANYMPYNHRPRIKDNKIGRNDPCPCGSGKKYKNCCLNSGEYETYHTA